MSADASRTCRGCGGSLAGRRPSTVYCKDACRKRVDRGGAVVDLPTPPSAVPPGSAQGLVEVTRAALVAVDRLETPLGASAISLAERIASRVDTGAGLASLNREWRATLAGAMENTAAAVSPLDELRLRREQRRGA